jgi:NADH-quinone oxidoreductase subunit J
MTALQIIFLITATVTLLSAVMVVTRRNLIHAALFLVFAFFGVAVVYAILNSGFLAVVQVLVYIGAIAILIIFAVMLTRRVVDTISFNRTWMVALIIAVALIAALVLVLFQWPEFNGVPQPLTEERDMVAELGQELVSVDGYMIPFLVVSLLLTGALIGAVVVAYQGQEKIGG